MTITEEDIDALVNGQGLIVFGDKITVTKIALVTDIPEESDEVTVWEGEVTSTAYSNCEIGNEMDWLAAGLPAESAVRIYFNVSNPDNWAFQVIEGHWGPKWFATDADGTQAGEYGHGFSVYNTDASVGYVEFDVEEGMYAAMQIDEKDYYVKPMNCPFHIEVYRSRLRSYRELPLRWAELGTVYRYEKSGSLHGLMRVRGFTQDDSHIICTPESIEEEIAEVLRFSLAINRAFGFTDIKAYLSTRPEKAVGEPERWEKAIDSLRKAVEKCGLDCDVDEGGGAFYGPKIDLKLRDAIGREWQTTTIQFDFNLPERFDMTYIGEDGKKHRPFMVHRALLGSLERFFGILVEHYAGAFPMWLAPEQARILPVSDKQLDLARKYCKELRAMGFRVGVDEQPAGLGAKIRAARQERVPYLLVLGEKEAENGTLAVRNRRDGELGEMDLTKLAEKMKEAVDNREIW